jgi:uncharacterized protein (TIGR02246 family)
LPPDYAREADSALDGRCRHLNPAEVFMIEQYLSRHPLVARRGAWCLVPLLIACSDSPDTFALEARARDSSPARSIVGPGGDLQGVQALVDEFEAAFVAKDAVAYGAAYAVDADFVNPIGVLTSGRAALVALHTFAFSGPFAGASFTAELHHVQFLTGTIALADVYTTLWGGAGTPPPWAVVSPDGKVRARSRWLVEKRNGEWEILVAYHRGWGH